MLTVHRRMKGATLLGKDSGEGKKRAGGKPEAASVMVTPQAAAQGSCLDALWVLLKEVPSLLEDSPAAAAHTLAAVLALWQASICPKLADLID